MSNENDRKPTAGAPEETRISPRRAFLFGTLAAVPAAALLGACAAEARKSERDEDEASADDDERGDEAADDDAPSTGRDAGTRRDASTSSGRDASTSDTLDAGDEGGGSRDEGDASSSPDDDGGASLADGGPSGRDAGVSRDAGRPSTCTVYPQQTQGPYYLDLKLMRNDITEGKPGKPLKLVIQVVTGSGCTPRPNTPVDVWHCDAAGVYSGYRGQLGGLDTREETFLRGTLVTDRDGRVEFTTIYPGWYPGRTPHIHFKVHTSDRTSAISQIYFPDAISRAVYATDPYSKHPGNFTPLASDSVNRSGQVSPVSPMPSGDGYVVNLTVTVAG